MDLATGVPTLDETACILHGTNNLLEYYESNCSLKSGLNSWTNWAV